MDQTAYYIENLNKEQKEAVENLDGPLLVLAGAGTGKTRVLTTRVAHILKQEKALPGQILAVTFTNKAAKEMTNRIEALAGSSIHWCGTFHSLSAKILRQNAARIGFSSSFTIIGIDDQTRLIKQILNDYNIDEKSNPAKLLAHIIGRYKDKGWLPNRVPVSEEGQFANGMGITLYSEYQKRLQLLQAMDFGDLILCTIELFNNNLDVLEHYQKKFKYVLVDEYQDTNVSQYLWLRLLAQGSNNICCVGDDDQSIYGWRGAEVKNILRFDKDFSEAKVIRLERNYRSTPSILSAASELISNNRNRHGKKLWTEDIGGDPVKLSIFYDDKQEAREIADEIDAKNRLHNVPLCNMAILVRAGYQTRSFEESLNYMKIPYRIVGGAKFYDRAEIKDMLAYMRLLQNNDDSLAFERIINTPRRGIGDATVSEIRQYAKDQEVSMFAAANYLIENSLIKGRVASAIAEFIGRVATWTNHLSTLNHIEVVERALEESGYKEMLKAQDLEEDKDRLDNIKELIRGMGEFPSLADYLEHVSLVTDNDSVADENKVNILTMHAAKGLEFDLVFLPGWEEGIFPSSRAASENNGSALEEERRLAYVAITRAKKHLHISYACNRRLFGTYQSSESSRFIDELPQDSYEIINNFSNQNRFDYLDYNNKLNKPFNREYGKSTLYRPIEQPQKDSASLKYGQTVMHKKFGKGRVLVVLEGNIAQVMFDACGFKKISMEFLEML